MKTIKLSKEEKYKSILNQIQIDLADYQNEKGIGMMDDKQWQHLFYDRMCANVTDFEDLNNE